MASALPAVRRSLLYVPASRTKFLEAALGRPTDNITLDLEDSVVPSAKDLARERLNKFLKTVPPRPAADSGARRPELAVRINDVSTRWFAKDILTAIKGSDIVDTIVVPKVNRPEDLHVVQQVIEHHAPWRLTSSKNPRAPEKEPAPPRIKILALIESARAIMDLRSIVNAYSLHNERGATEDPSRPKLAGLIFAAEDFALDMGITRSKGLSEMLYARSAVVTAAKAAKLESAIDLVCTSYGIERDGVKILKEECDNGRAMGFTGKQCIHPSQLETVNQKFRPSQEALEWAARVVIGNERAEENGLGAWNLDGSMIDRPVSEKAKWTLKFAESCGMDVAAVMEKHKDQQPG